MKASIPVAIALLSTSCASITVLPVKNSTGSIGQTLDSTDSGVHFYRPALHVWITVAPPAKEVDVSVLSEKTTVPETRKNSKSGTGLVKEAQKETTQVTTEESSGGKTLETTKTTTSSAQKRSYQAQIVELPDFSQEYVIQWHSGFGSVKPGFTLSSGWNLVGFASEVDSKASELVTSFGGLAAGGLLAGSSNFKGPGLYRLDVDATGRFSLGTLVLPLE